MANKGYDENKALQSIMRATGAKWEQNGMYKYLYIPINAHVGIHTWGKIDFLVHYCGWGLVRTAPKNVTNSDNDDKNNKKSRKDKSEMKHKKNFRKMNM